MANETESLDALVVQISADLQPLFTQLDAAVKMLKERVKAMQGDANILVGVDAQRLLGVLNQVQGQVKQWASKTSDAATIKIQGDATGLGSAFQSVNRVIKDMTDGLSKFYLAASGAQMITGQIKTLTDASNTQERALTRLSTAVNNFGMAGTGAYERLVAQADNLQQRYGLWSDEEIESTQAMLISFGATENQVREIIPAMLDMSAAMQRTGGEGADLESVAKAVGKAMQGNASALQRYGLVIEDTSSSGDRFNGILSQMGRFHGQAASAAETNAGAEAKLKNALDELKEGAGKTLQDGLAPLERALAGLLNYYNAIPESLKKWSMALEPVHLTLMLIEKMSANIKEMLTMLGVITPTPKSETPAKVAPTGITTAESVDKEKKLFDERLKYYEKTVMSQIAIDLMQVRTELSNANLSEEKKRELLDKEKALIDKQAQEYVRINKQAEDDARKEAEKSAKEREKLESERIKKTQDAQIEYTKAFDDANHQIYLDSLDAEQKEVALVLDKAQKQRQALYQYSLDYAEIQQQLIQLTENSESEISAIQQKYQKQRQDEAKRLQEELVRQQKEAFDKQKSEIQKYVSNFYDPISGMVENAYNTLNARAAVFAEGFRSLMSPLQNAFSNLLSGMKVSWGNVLKQMVAQFGMIFVNKFLAWVGEMIMQWVLGESSKTAATAAGAGARTAIVAAETASSKAMTVSSLDLAIAEIFAAHAGIPFVGVAIAQGFIAQMMAAYAAFAAMAQGLVTAGGVAATAFAEGGRIDRPTLALMGEAGPELVAPEKQFVQVIREVVVAATEGLQVPANNPNITRNIHFHNTPLVDAGQRSFLRSTARKMKQMMAAVDREKP